MISDLVRQVAVGCGENTALAVWRLEEAVAAHRALVAAALKIVSQRDKEATKRDKRILALLEENRALSEQIYISAVVDPCPVMTSVEDYNDHR